MEKIERNRSVDSDQKGREFLHINSLRELLPIIFFAFFFAYTLGSYPFVDSTKVEESRSVVESNEAAYVEEQNNLQNIEPQEEKIYLNTSPIVSTAKRLPIIESIQKRQPAQEKTTQEKEEVIARPHFPKTKAREALPTLEVVQPIQKNIPSEEKFTATKVEANKEIIVQNESVEEAALFNNTVENLAVLEGRTIKALEEIELEMPEMTIKAGWTPITTTITEAVSEEPELIAIPVLQENKAVESLSVTNYNSSDFKWAVNNYNQGIKKSARFTKTPDGKASYSCTDAGIVLKINDLSEVDPAYGIFVEKSEDGIEYSSIGIINAENTDELYYFDAQQSFDGQHHYRFRSTDVAGKNLEFGRVSVIRRASIVPVLSHINAAGKYNLVLESTAPQTIKYEIEEAWGSLNANKGTKQLTTGKNTLSLDLAGDPGLYFLTVSTAAQDLELLIEKPGISPDLSFYEQEVSGKQSLSTAGDTPSFINKPNTLSFDFYLKNGNTLIFNAGEYNSETVKIKKAKIGTLPATLQARHSEEALWFMASSNISYLHQKVPVILEHNNQEIAAQINIFSSKNTIRPISHFSPDGDGVQDKWRIPGIESCPNTDLMVFNDWGNLIYKTNNVTDKNIWKGQKDGKNLAAGMYYYVLGQYGGWVYLER